MIELVLSEPEAWSKQETQSSNMIKVPRIGEAIQYPHGGVHHNHLFRVKDVVYVLDRDNLINSITVYATCEDH